MMYADFEKLFREEARKALGAARPTVDQLINTIAEFISTATPEEALVFGAFVRAVAAGSGEPVRPSVSSETAAVSEAVAALADFRTAKAAQEAPGSQTATAAADAPIPAASPATAPRRATAAPFRVSYPAPASRPRAVAPPPDPPEPEPLADDIEDFTDPASATA